MNNPSTQPPCTDTTRLRAFARQTFASAALVALIALVTTGCNSPVEPDVPESEYPHDIWVSSVETFNDGAQFRVAFETDNTGFELNYNGVWWKLWLGTEPGMPEGSTRYYMPPDTRLVTFQTPTEGEDLVDFINDVWPYGSRVPSGEYYVGVELDIGYHDSHGAWGLQDPTNDFYVTPEPISFIHPDDEFEPNNDIASATDLSRSLSHGGLIVRGDTEEMDYILADEDFYKFEVTEAPAELAIYVDPWEPMEGSTTVVRLHDSTGSILVEEVQQYAAIEHTVTTVGTYYVSLAVNAFTFPYRLRIYSSEPTVVPADDHWEDANDSPSTAPTTGNLVLNTNAGYGDYVSLDDDYWTFDIPASGNQLTVRLKFSHSEGDIDLIVVDSNLSIIGSSLSATDDETVVISDISAGRYHVWVVGDFAGNTYSLELQYED